MPREIGPLKGLARRAQKVFRLRDISALSADDRSVERNRRVALSAATAAGSRATSLVVGLVTVPLTLRYLGAEQYGLWVTITSFTSLVAFADLGLGRGLVNGIAEADGRSEQEATAQLVSSAFYMLILTSGLFAGVFAAIYPVVPWGKLFNVASTEASAVAGTAVAVLASMTLVGVPLGLAIRIREGFQEGFLASFWTGLGSVISLAALVAAIAMKAGLPWLVLALSSGSLVAAILNGAFVLRSRPWLLPRLRTATVAAGRRLAGLGFVFFAINVASMLTVQTDNIVVARILGAEAVTQYAVPTKLFMLIPAIAGFGLYPLWPAFREALTRGDQAWVTRALRRSLLFATTFGLGVSILLVVTATPLIHVWAGRGVTPRASLLIALGMYGALATVSTAFSMFFFAVNAVRFVATALSIFAVLNLGLSIYLTRVTGIAGPAWGSVLSMAPVLVVYAIYLRLRVQRLPRDGHGDTLLHA
jgi:O-antigen/teichoic acid export membrane protein